MDIRMPERIGTMKEIICVENAASITQGNDLGSVENVSRLICEMLISIDDPEYAQKIYSIVYSEHNSR